MLHRVLLTTVDNPFDPFTQWDDWYSFDTTYGYNTCGLLSRVTDASEALDDHAAVYGMLEIVRHNLSGMHVIVTEESVKLLIDKKNPRNKLQ